MTRMTVRSNCRRRRRRRPTSSLCPLLLLLTATVITALGFLVFQTEARRRNPLDELSSSSSSSSSVVHNSDGEARRPHRRLQEKGGDGGNSAMRGGSASTSASASTNRRVIGRPVDVPVAKSPDDHRIQKLPLLDPSDFPQDQWAGLLPVSDKKDGYLFYWLFAPDPKSLSEAKNSGRVKEDESNVPLLIWLNGGPACSSMDGLWIENGPFRLQPDRDPKSQPPGWKNIRVHPHSWNRAPAYTLYIDQPVGTGLAFTTSGNYPNNDQRVNEDFYYFLTEFLKLHSSTLGLDKDKANGNIPTLRRPLFFSGESHAGHYIPSMMNHIRKQNQKTDQLKQKGGVVMPLSGAAIGNGWFDPIYQYSAQETAYGYGLIGKAQERALAAKEEACRADLRRKNYSSGTCFGLLSEVVNNALGTGNPMKLSQYDQRKHEARGRDRTFPAGHKDVEAYLGNTEHIANAPVMDVLEALHAAPSWEAGQRYRECTDPPYNALAHQDGLGVVPDIVELLEDHREDQQAQQQQQQPPVRLLFFNGVHDLICNHVGNENALENLPWEHREEYVASARYSWIAPSTNTLGGYAKEFRNLIFLKVLDSGHMVPMDVPVVALDMMVTFLYGGSFDTYKQNVPRNQLPDDGDGCGGGSGSNNEKCPVCDDTTTNNNNDHGNNDGDGNKCTEQQCLEKFQFATGDDNDTDKDGSMAAMSSGIVAGVFAFLVLALIAKCCCGISFRRSGSGIRSRSSSRSHSRDNSFAKVGQIELADTHEIANGGGYRDDEDSDDNFEEEPGKRDD